MSSSSASSEYEALRAELLQLVTRPNTYGWPESVEQLGKHTVHIMLSILDSMWTFPRTETLWRGLVQHLGLGSKLAHDEESHRIYRWWQWGADEDRARTQVVGAWRRIWSQLCREGRDLPVTRSWIESILEDPEWVGPPDVLDDVLVGLIRVVFAAEPERLRVLLDAEMAAVGANSARGLADVGTDEERWARAPKRVPSYSSEGHVAAGIREMLRLVDGMRAAGRTTEEPCPD